ncbi:alpha/beta hydrolase family protein [Rubritalea marina]|uniref:alpha/beta hydrolase family protein n=1 Tax=Rubritalea marina TaxID=361055 RepID=UPI00035F55D0|nr:alpha/beta hydrolase [Rubritalea marina]
MKLHNQHGEKLDYIQDLSSSREDVLVVLGHGVTGNKDRPLQRGVYEGLVAKGWPVLSLSFAGNGDSEGNFEDATIPKEVDDLHAVLDQVKGVKRIAYVGHSMGGAVGALAAARDERISVLVSLAGMVRAKKFFDTEFGDVVPGQGCMWDEEDCPLSEAYAQSMADLDNTLTAAKDVRAPWLLIHGDADDVVLPQDSEDLYLTLRGKKKHLVIEGADHCFEGYYPQVVDEIDAWLEQHLG